MAVQIKNIDPETQAKLDEMKSLIQAINSDSSEMARKITDEEIIGLVPNIDHSLEDSINAAANKSSNITESVKANKKVLIIVAVVVVTLGVVAYFFYKKRK